MLTGQMPFHTLRDSEISYKVIQGERPDLPANAKDLGISDKLWELLIRCWFGDCTDRPSISEILQHLSESAAREMIFPPLRYSPFPSCEGFSGSVGPERGNDSQFELSRRHAYSRIAGVLVTSNVNSSKSSSAEAPNLSRFHNTRQLLGGGSLSYFFRSYSTVVLHRNSKHYPWDNPWELQD